MHRNHTHKHRTGAALPRVWGGRGTLVVIALTVVAATGFAQDVILEEQFNEPFPESYEVWGTADPFNRVEAYEGNLELEGSFGFEAFGVFFREEIDLSDGPVTISFDLVRNSSNEGSEVCFWFVNQYLIDGSPWTEGDFIRVGFFSTREEVGTNALLVQETSPEARGVGSQLAAVPSAFTMGERFHVEWELSVNAYAVRIDGEEVAAGTHSFPAATGYLHIHDWNSLEEDVDLVSNLVIRK
jgi:hypothetical protein